MRAKLWLLAAFLALVGCQENTAPAPPDPVFAVGGRCYGDIVPWHRRDLPLGA
jgi:hypothetical protein